MYEFAGKSRRTTSLMYICGMYRNDRRARAAACCALLLTMMLARGGHQWVRSSVTVAVLLLRAANPLPELRLLVLA